MTTRGLAHITLLAAAVALAACSTPAPPPRLPTSIDVPVPPAPPVVPPVAGRPAPPPPVATAPVPPPPSVWPQLQGEQRYLEDLFRGTPVVVEPAGPGPNAALRLEVPQRFAFDDGQSVVKPPLGAVLDKVATSLQRQPKARVQVAASAPERSANVTKHLVSRGVAAYRIEKLPPRNEGVELRLRIVDVAAVDRLADPPRAQP